MSRLGVRWGLAVVGIAGFGLTFAPAHASQMQATPVPADCGTPVMSWGGGIADDVVVDLLGVEGTSGGPATPEATPVAADWFFHAQLKLRNVGPTPATVTVAEITLVLCDGRQVQASTDTTHPSLPEGELPVGETRAGWVAFPLAEGDVPIKLIVPVARRGLTGGRVEFPLVGDDAGSAGAAGADAVGGDAVGADGTDGADATGAAGDGGQD